MIFNATPNPDTGDIEHKTIKKKIKDLYNSEYVFPESDINRIKNYNACIDAGIPQQQAFNQTMRDASKSVQKLVKDADGGTIALNRLKKASAASTIKLKAMATIGNIAAFVLIAKGIQFAADAIDNFVHRTEYAKEDISNLESEYEATCSELESINSELLTTRQRIEELESKGHLTLTEETELNNLKEQNKEPERSLALKQKEEEIKAEKTIAKMAEEKDNILSDYGKNTSYLEELSEQKKHMSGK